MLVEKVSYNVNWKVFKQGYSFFIPCLNTREAKKQIRSILTRLRYKIVMKVVIEEGVKGLRIWRI